MLRRIPESLGHTSPTKRHQQVVLFVGIEQETMSKNDFLLNNPTEASHDGFGAMFPVTPDTVAKKKDRGQFRPFPPPPHLSLQKQRELSEDPHNQE